MSLADRGAAEPGGDVAFVLRLVGAAGAGGELVAGGEVAFDDLVERDAGRHRQRPRPGLLELGAEPGQLTLGGGAGAAEAPARLDHPAGDGVLAQVEAHPPDAGLDLDQRTLSVAAARAARRRRRVGHDAKTSLQLDRA